MPIKQKGICLTVTIIFLFSLGLSGCSSASPTAHELSLAPVESLPDFVRSAPPEVQEAFRFAIANPEILSAYPCYCGCNAMGHENNLDCYVKEVLADGTLVFEDHALG